MKNVHKLDNTVQEAFELNGKTYYRPSLALPYFTTKGLPIWKRFNEKNWQPQCDCGKIFSSMDEYREHYYREANEL